MATSSCTENQDRPTYIIPPSSKRKRGDSLIPANHLVINEDHDKQDLEGLPSPSTLQSEPAHQPSPSTLQSGPANQPSPSNLQAGPAFQGRPDPATTAKGSVIIHHNTEEVEYSELWIGEGEYSEYWIGDSLETEFRNLEVKKSKKRLTVGMFSYSIIYIYKYIYNIFI